MLDFLYENVGKKIKRLAKWTFAVEAISSIIGGIVLAFDDGIYILLCIFGPLAALVSSWILYAIGQIADDARFIRDNQQALQNNSEPEPASDFVQIQNEKDDIVQAEIPLVKEKTEEEKAELERKEQERKERLEQMAAFRARGLCQHCGGEFSGLITKKCSRCGISKNY